MTGNSASYQFGLLPPGNYQVKIEASGFKPIEIPSATVSVTETAVLNGTLQVGLQAQSVTVESNAEEAVQTASSAMGTVVNTQTVAALPLSTRNYTNLLAMSAERMLPWSTRLHTIFCKWRLARFTIRSASCLATLGTCHSAIQQDSSTNAWTVGACRA